MTNSTDEIDLLKILSKVLLAIKRNFEIVIALFIIGIGLGYLYYEVAPTKFESRMLISSDILTDSYSKSLVENLQKLIDEDNFETLSKKMGIPSEITAELDHIEVKSALRAPADTPEDSKVYLNIEARVRNNSVWPQVQTGIIGYLQTNEFVKIRVEQKRKYSSQLIEKINLELEDLEKLKTQLRENGNQSSKGNLVLFDPTTINSTIVDLNKQKIILQNDLETVNSVQVVEGFTTFNSPASPKLSIALSGGAVLGLVLAGMFIVLRSLRSLMKSSEEKV